MHTCIRNCDSYLRPNPALVADLHELIGKRLLCHCRLSEPCHGDALIAAVSELVFNVSSVDTTIQVGIFREPDEFAEAALGSGHLFEQHVELAAIIEGLRFRMSSSTSTIVQFRRAAVDRWRAHARSLSPRERELHSSLDPGVEKIMHGKSLLLLRDMLLDFKFPNANELIHYMSTGFPLAGPFPRTSIFPPVERLAVYDIPDLWASCEQIRAEVLASCRSSGDAELDDSLFAVTLKETENGWLEGPLGQCDLAALGAWVPSRRFAVRQGGKLHRSTIIPCRRSTPA